MVALAVSFWSSFRRRGTEQELFLRERQVQQLAAANRALEEKVRWVESRFARSMSLGKKLNLALAQEQARSRQLAERLQQTQPPRTDGP